MKKACFLFLLPLMAAALLCSCGENADTAGRDFRVFTYGRYAEMYSPSEEAPAAVDRALYLAEKKTEDALGVTISVIDTGESGYKGQSAALRAAVGAGEDFAEVSLEHATDGVNNALDGLFADLRQTSADLTKPCWNPGIADSMTCGGKLFLAAPSNAVYGLGATKALMVSHSGLARYGMTLPTETVLDGNWTLDRLTAMTAGVYEDVNGDGARDDGDFYGYVSYAAQNFWLCCCDAELIGQDLTLDPSNPRTQAVVEKLSAWYRSDGVRLLVGSKDALGRSRTEWQDALYSGGCAMIAAGDLSAVSGDDTALLPLPKLTEEQDGYRSFSSELFTAVPVTADAEFAVSVLEAWAENGLDTAVPAFLGGIRTENAEEKAVVELIAATRTVSFAYTHETLLGHLLTRIFDGGESYASCIAANEEASLQRLEEIRRGYGM